MKVCFLVSNLGFGGAERTVAYLANWGVENGYNVDVVDTIDDVIAYTFNDKVNLVQLHYKQKPRSKNVFKELHNAFHKYSHIKKSLKEYIKTNNPDLIYCILYPESIYTFGLHLKVPVVIAESSNPKWLKTKWKKLARKIIFKKSNAVLYQTQRAADFYKFLKKKKFAVIPNAVGNPLAYSVKYNGDITQNKISAVGSLRAQKDYPTLLQAFKLVKEKHPDYILEIFGSGVDEQNLKALATELAIENSVSFMGSDLEALKKISNAKCYVLSSISEGMPNTLMEAMAIGMPCVSTDCEFGPRELIEDGKNGLLVPIKSPEKLAEAINKMIENREFALKCGEEAKKLKETNSVDEIAKKYYKFFEDVVKRGIKSDKKNY